MCCLYISGATISISYARRNSIILINYSSMLALMWDPVMYQTVTSLPPYALITTVRSINSNTVVVDLAYFLFILVLCQLPSVHDLTFIDPYHLYFKNISDITASLFFLLVSDPYARGSIVYQFCIWVISFMTASLPLFWVLL